MLYDELQDCLLRLSGTNRALSTCLTRLSRLAFSVGALQWKANTLNELMEDLQKNNLDLMIIEIDWLREKGYLPKNADVKLSFAWGRQQALKPS